MQSSSTVFRPAWRSFYKLWLISWLILPLAAIAWKRYSSMLILSQHSLVLRRGILNISLTEVGLGRIQTVEIHQSLIERILGVGSIQVGTSATYGYEIEFAGLERPKAAAEEIHAYSQKLQEGK